MNFLICFTLLTILTLVNGVSFDVDYADNKKSGEPIATDQDKVLVCPVVNAEHGTSTLFDPSKWVDPVTSVIKLRVISCFIGTFQQIKTMKQHKLISWGELLYTRYGGFGVRIRVSVLNVLGQVILYSQDIKANELMRDGLPPGNKQQGGNSLQEFLIKNSVVIQPYTNYWTKQNCINLVPRAVNIIKNGPKESSNVLLTEVNSCSISIFWAKIASDEKLKDKKKVVEDNSIKIVGFLAGLTEQTKFIKDAIDQLDDYKKNLEENKDLGDTSVIVLSVCQQYQLAISLLQDFNLKTGQLAFNGLQDNKNKAS